MIRIISGEHRGRKIRAPKQLNARPTTDRAKEGLFNILNNRFYFDEIKALDLFSGTGNLSYELVSRGCTQVTAVDADRLAVKFIGDTASQLNMHGLQAVRNTAENYLSGVIGSYDLILADPPYQYDRYEWLIEEVFNRELLSDGGLLVLEHDVKTRLDELAHFSERRTYGNSCFSFFEKEEN